MREAFKVSVFTVIVFLAPQNLRKAASPPVKRIMCLVVVTERAPRGARNPPSTKLWLEVPFSQTNHTAALSTTENIV